jgi:DNA-binding XRE family transcriptional regulator
MEHEDKSMAPLTPPEVGGRARVVSAATGEGGGAPPSSSKQRVDVPDEPEASPESGAGPDDKPPRDRKPPQKGPNSHPNNVRRLRIERMMSKAELARRANVSVLTIDRVEKGYGCRMDTKRKILEALGLSLADRVRVFGDED